MKIGDAKIIITAQDEASAKLNAVGDSLTGVGKKAGISTGLLLKAGAAIAAFATGVAVASLKMAADFDTAMREVFTLTDLTVEEFGAYSDAVRDVSKEVGISAKELATALYPIVSASIAVEDSMYFLKAASRLGIAGVADTASAALALTNVINAFKLEATDVDRVADILFTTVKGGQTTIDELSASLFQVSDWANAAGISIDIVAAALATMTKQGTPTNVATTRLRELIRGIILPSARMADVIEEAGYASGQAMLDAVGFAGALNIVSQATGGSVEKMGELFGSAEAVGAALSLTGQNAAVFFADIEAIATDSAGSVEEAFDKMNEGVGRQYEMLKVELENMMIDLGIILIPALLEAFKQMQPYLDNFSAWLSENDDLAGDFVSAIKTLGYFLYGVAKVFEVLGSMVAGIVINAMKVLDFVFPGRKPWNTYAEDYNIAMPTTEALDIFNQQNATAGLLDGGVANAMQAGGGSVSTINVEVGTFVGNESAFQEFARTIDSAIGQNNRRTSFGTVNPGYYGGTSAP